MSLLPFTREEFCFEVLRHTDLHTVGQFSALSKTIRDVTSQVFQSLITAFPGMAYVCLNGETSGGCVECLHATDSSASYWSALKSAVAGFKEFQAGMVMGRMYVFSGCDSPLAEQSSDNSQSCMSPWLRDSRRFWASSTGILNNQFPSSEALPDLPCPRYGCGVGVCKGEVYFCGGTEEDDDSEASEFWNERTGQWEKMLPALQVKCLVWWVHGMLAHQLFVAPPRLAYEFKPSSKLARRFKPPTVKLERVAIAECFDTRTGRWQSLAPMLEARNNPAVICLNGKLYVCGGSGNGGNALCSVERFDPLIGKWEQMPSMTYRRAYPAAFISEGRLCVAAGVDDLNQQLHDIECLYPERSTWAPWTPEHSAI